MKIKRLLGSILAKYAPKMWRARRRWRARQLERRLALAPPPETPYGFRFVSPHLSAESWEPSEVAEFLKNIENAATCIDIGANTGIYSCLAASLGKRVIAVEPLASNLLFLYKNLLCNEFVDVEVFPLGLSSKPGIKKLYGAGLNASFVEGWAHASEMNYSVVPMTTLDALVGSRLDGQTIFVKMDVEGFELEVLRGAEGVLSRSPKPTWLVEVVLTEQVPGGLNSNFEETFKVFWSHGYQAETADKEKRLVQPADVRRWVENGSRDFGSYNYFFKPI